jgi:hypothetical protein
VGAKAEADSFAALRNDNQRSKGKGNTEILRFALDDGEKQTEAKAKAKAGVSPLRQTMGPFGSGRDDGAFAGCSLEM